MFGLYAYMFAKNLPFPITHQNCFFFFNNVVFRNGSMYLMQGLLVLNLSFNNVKHGLTIVWNCMQTEMLSWT